MGLNSEKEEILIETSLNLIVNKEQQNQLIAKYHEFSNHRGASEVVDKIKRYERAYWKTMLSDALQYKLNCEICL